MSGRRPPFVIFALPRSRTFWLSRFLSGDGTVKPCGHDIAIGMDSLSDVKTALTEHLCGTVETGSMMAWRWLRKTLPEARFIVVRRPLDDVAASLERCGLNVPRSVLELRAAWLDEISARHGTITLNAADLDQPEACAALFQQCRGAKCSPLWLACNMGANIQLDLNRRVELLRSRAAQIEGLKAAAEMADRRLRDKYLPFVEYQEEPWDRIETDAARMGAEHFREVGDGSDPRRPFALDLSIMREMAKSETCPCFTVRADGVLAGYIQWTIQRDPESVGLLIANQGPWFVAPDERYRGMGTALFTRSIAALKDRGVKCAFPHHRTEGRGARLGSFFQRIGAKEIQRGYSLWIGD